MSDRATRGSGSHAAVAVPPASSPRRRIYSVLIHDKEIFLHVGTHTIGRGLSCDLVVNDRLVSREHARLVIREASAAIIDLGSTNGVYVNENRVQGTEELRDGDLIVIGSQELTLKAAVSDDERVTSPRLEANAPGGEISEVIEREPPPSGRFRTKAPDSGPQAAPSSEPAQIGVLPAQIGALRVPDSRSDSGPHLTEKADAIQVMGRLADRAMVMGNYEAAEHVLQGHLEALIGAARSDVPLPAARRETASRYALRLADALQRPAWVDYVVELHLIARAVMSEWCTSRMMLVVPSLPGIDVEQLFFYQQMLKGRLEQIPAEERVFAEQLIALEPRH